MNKLCECWLRDVPKLSSENWGEIYKFSFQILVSLRDKLIQFKITHRSYYTPYKQFKIFPSNPQNCWRCAGTPGNFIHIFWTCPKIRWFWREVLRVIEEVMLVQLDLEAGTCLLGLVEETLAPREKRRQVGLLLFYARKAIVLNWKKVETPSVVQWKNLINNNLSL